jgi:hypothetical protein
LPPDRLQALAQLIRRFLKESKLPPYLNQAVEDLEIV